MQDLFAPSVASAPLAERMRPRTIDDVVGQSHLLAAGKPLRVAFESGRPHSMILWGPPGVGKTTLARLMADAFGMNFIAISAVLGGVKDIRDAVERAQVTRAQSGNPTVVFVDEVHRFNKAQQDAFLPHVESGLFVFVGATTENPSFEVIGALLSRAAVYVLQPLTRDELEILLERALRIETRGLDIDPQARAMLFDLADGDARRLLNALEVVNNAARERELSLIDADFLRDSLPATLRRFDKGGENFYDQISALHKSVRGSDPDASLYWMVRMFDGGVDPRYVARRAIRMATEDIGLADPRALEVALAAADTYERLGSPEGELALAQAIVYLACAPKSNAVYRAYGAARAFVEQDGSRPVPLHLRNAPTRLMKDLGYGAGYRYAHNEANAVAAGETYLPEGITPQQWYQPTDRGIEARIGERLAELRLINAGAGATRKPREAK
ncbi:MAG: replication-associated recombination protein A [Burkholderiaceae bacterium]